MFVSVSTGTPAFLPLDTAFHQNWTQPTKSAACRPKCYQVDQLTSCLCCFAFVWKKSEPLLTKAWPILSHLRAYSLKLLLLWNPIIKAFLPICYSLLHYRECFIKIPWRKNKATIVLKRSFLIASKGSVFWETGKLEQFHSLIFLPSLQQHSLNITRK